MITLTLLPGWRPFRHLSTTKIRFMMRRETSILWWETGLFSKITKFFAIWQQWTVNWNPDFLPSKEWMSCIFRKANEREQGEAAWCWLPAFFRQPLLHLRSVPVPLKVVDLPLKKNREVLVGAEYTYTFQRVVNSDPNLDPYSATSRIPIHVPIPDPPFRNSTD